MPPRRSRNCTAADCLLLLDVGSYRCRALCSRQPDQCFIYPAGMVQVRSDREDDAELQYAVGPDLRSLDLTVPRRVRTATTPQGAGYLCDATAAVRLIAVALDFFHMTDTSSTAIILAVPPHGSIETAALWWHVLFQHFCFTSATFVSPSFLRLVGLASVSGAFSTTGFSAMAEGQCLVADVGHSRTAITPYVAFRPLYSVAQRIDLGGYHVSRRLEEHLTMSQIQLSGCELLVDMIKRDCVAVWPLAPCRPLWREESFRRLQTVAAAVAAESLRSGRSVAEITCHDLLRRLSLHSDDAPIDAPSDSEENVDVALFLLPTPLLSTNDSSERVVEPPSHVGRFVPGKVAASHLERALRSMSKYASPTAVVLHHGRWSLMEILYSPRIAGGALLSRIAADTALGMEATGIAPLIGIAKKNDSLLPSGGLIEAVDFAWHSPTLPSFVQLLLQRHVVLFGGCASAPGFIQRFKNELDARRHDEWHVENSTPPLVVAVYEEEEEEAATEDKRRPVEGVSIVSGRLVLTKALETFGRAFTLRDSDEASAKDHRPESTASASSRRYRSKHAAASRAASTDRLTGFANALEAVLYVLSGPSTVRFDEAATVSSEAAIELIHRACHTPL